MKKNENLKKLVLTSIMAALGYVAFMFLKIPIPLGDSSTALHVGNAFCVLAALILGGVYGGVAGSIGMTIADLMSPAYITSAPKTFVLKFLIGLIVGFVAHKLGHISEEGKSAKHVLKWSIIASICGLGFNVIADPIVGYFYKTYILGIPQDAAKIIQTWAAGATAINAVAGTILACLLYNALRPALKRFGLLFTIGKKGNMTKFTEMKYTRPNIEELLKKSDELLEKFNNANSAKEQIDIFYEVEKMNSGFSTMATLASIRFSINTNDEFYKAEDEFFNEAGPVLEEKSQALKMAMLGSKFRPELEMEFGKLLFEQYEIETKTFKPEVIELLQEENKLVSSYQALYASLKVEIDGKTIPVTKLLPYKQSLDREVRKKAFILDGECFDAHREEFDSIFDKLVKIRTEIARKLGFENYIQLGYYRLGRTCYDSKDVKEFRDQIAKDIVPVIVNVNKNQMKRVGIEDPKFYDTTISFKDGNPVPTGTPEEILAAGKEMYNEMSKETAEFINFMYDNELFDVLAKEGKAPGGYCTEIPDYKAPFIFSNFNGTAGDVDVLTHEAGHAFEAYRAFKHGYISAYRNPTMEACEVHSMSMEFLTEPYHYKFFGENTKKYELYHCEDSLVFLPYGTMIDEFQHIAYENPDLTPEQRNEEWSKLEKKYRPYIDFDNIPFYSRGAGWQRQLHVYMYPLYYIDYCMAQTVAFQIWLMSLEDRDKAWKTYLSYTDCGGTMTFVDLLKHANLKLPYENGVVKEIADKVAVWLEENNIE